VTLEKAAAPINYTDTTSFSITIPGDGRNVGMFIDMMYDNSEGDSSNNPAADGGNTEMCVLRTGPGPWEKTGSSYESDDGGDGILSWDFVQFPDQHAGVLVPFYLPNTQIIMAI
jgi:hypothetical protein